jgi:hypothetical protein
MKFKLFKFGKLLCVLGLSLAFLAVCSKYGVTEEPEKRKKEPVKPQTSSRFIEVRGDIRVDRKADGSKIKCSEVVELSERVVVDEIVIHRRIYIVDMANRTFADDNGSTDIPQGTITGTEHGQYFGGKDESVLDTWESNFSIKKDLGMVITSAVMKLADGRQIVCRFQPLFFTKGQVFSEAEMEVEDWESNPKPRPMENDEVK